VPKSSIAILRPTLRNAVRTWTDRGTSCMITDSVTSRVSRDGSSPERLEGVGNRGHQVFVLELDGRDVDAYPKGRVAAAHGRDVPAGLPEDPRPDSAYDPRCF